ncbi:hypothetical protein AALP_AA7G223000 [Arabis alpina]|uniref:UBE2O-like SH3-C domain-containing protein n=1 Tax=Arabis alpina TaxID=50452 RepID=A0A087GJU6_ARAAL|nr:hypothetical protein AALP_AA7G223000 [Arabis alpina]
MAEPKVEAEYMEEIDKAPIIDHATPIKLESASENAGTAQSKIDGSNVAHGANPDLKTALDLCEGVKAKQPEITYADLLEGDVVMNIESAAVGAVFSENVFPVAEIAPFPIRKEELILVARSFNLGDLVSSVRDRATVGVVVNAPKRVDLAGDDGEVTNTELSVSVKFSDGSRLTGIDPDPTKLEALYANALERHLATPYYTGQEESGAEPPATVLQASEVRLFLPPPFSRGFWVLGSRCFMDGKGYLVCNFHPTKITVKWRSGDQEEIDPREVVLADTTTTFFDGKYQIGYIVCCKEELPNRPYFGFVSGLESGRIKMAWEDGTTSMVAPEEIDYVEDVEDNATDDEDAPDDGVGLGDEDVDVADSDTDVDDLDSDASDTDDDGGDSNTDDDDGGEVID